MGSGDAPGCAEGDEIRIPAQIFRACAWKISNQLSPRSVARDTSNTLSGTQVPSDTDKKRINSFAGFMPVIRETLYLPLFTLLCVARHLLVLSHWPY